jgi:probable rRNA maturation factor
MPALHRIEIAVDDAYTSRVAPGAALEGMPGLLADAIRNTLESRKPAAAPGGPKDETVPRAVSLRLTDARTVQRLNARYLGHDEPTDVLSFNTDFPGLRDPHGVEELGALIIAVPVAARGARDRHVSLDDELCLLAVHGTLHLLGFDHETPAEDAAMRRLELDALTRLGRPQAARAG